MAMKALLSASKELKFENAVKKTPFDRKAHTECIDDHRNQWRSDTKPAVAKQKALQSLRNAKSRFLEIFPPTSTEFAAWIEDEQHAIKEARATAVGVPSSDSGMLLETSAIDSLVSLLQQMRGHPLCIPAWQLLLTLSPAGGTRTMQQSALDSEGRHYSRGSALFRQILELEASSLDLLDEEPSDEQLEQQELRQLALWKQLMATPHRDFQDSLTGFRAWIEENEVESEIESAASIRPPALQQECMRFEEGVSSSDDVYRNPSLWKQYIHCVGHDENGLLLRVYLAQRCVWETTDAMSRLGEATTTTTTASCENGKTRWALMGSRRAALLTLLAALPSFDDASTFKRIVRVLQWFGLDDPIVGTQIAWTLSSLRKDPRVLSEDECKKKLSDFSAAFCGHYFLSKKEESEEDDRWADEIYDAGSNIILAQLTSSLDTPELGLKLAIQNCRLILNAGRPAAAAEVLSDAVAIITTSSAASASTTKLLANAVDDVLNLLLDALKSTTVLHDVTFIRRRAVLLLSGLNLCTPAAAAAFLQVFDQDVSDQLKKVKSRNRARPPTTTPTTRKTERSSHDADTHAGGTGTGTDGGDKRQRREEGGGHHPHRPTEPQPEQVPDATVFIPGIPAANAEADLRALFADLTVVRMDLKPTKKDPNVVFAFVQFSSVEERDRAVKLNGTIAPSTTSAPHQKKVHIKPFQQKVAATGTEGGGDDTTATTASGVTGEGRAAGGGGRGGRGRGRGGMRGEHVLDEMVTKPKTNSFFSNLLK